MMSKDPFVVTWMLKTDSLGTLKHVTKVIEPLTNLKSFNHSLSTT